MIDIIAIPALQDNYIWAIRIKNTQAVIIVDPGVADPVIHFLQQQPAQPCAIFITHHHWDHTNGVAELTQLYQVPVYGSSKSTNAFITHPVNDNDTFQINAAPF
jgi:hydroxyacylglutathione hydrolase